MCDTSRSFEEEPQSSSSYSPTTDIETCHEESAESLCERDRCNTASRKRRRRAAPRRSATAGASFRAAVYEVYALGSRVRIDWDGEGEHGDGFWGTIARLRGYPWVNVEFDDGDVRAIDLSERLATWRSSSRISIGSLHQATIPCHAVEGGVHSDRDAAASDRADVLLSSSQVEHSLRNGLWPDPLRDMERDEEDEG